MKHDIARKINELFQKHYNVKFDENEFIHTDIIDVENNVVLTAEQYNQLIEPTNNVIYLNACSVLCSSYDVPLDETHTLELFFLKLLAQKNIYAVHLDTDDETVCILRSNTVISDDLLNAIQIAYNHSDLYHNAKNVSLALTACVARLIENDDALSFDLSETLSNYLATSNLSELITDIDANF